MKKSLIKIWAAFLMMAPVMIGMGNIDVVAYVNAPLAVGFIYGLSLWVKHSAIAVPPQKIEISGDKG